MASQTKGVTVATDRVSRTTKYKLLEIELKTLANSVDIEGEEEKPDTIVRSY